jgi:TonB family protein
MLVWATRTVSALTLRALLYAGLFLIVVTAHVALTNALRAAGWNAGLSMAVSGAMVLAVVLACVQAGAYFGERRAAAREIARMRQGLPAGPCCVVARAVEGDGEGDMPWILIGKIRPRYPSLARRLGVEGFALVHFEINSEGAPKNIHCLDAWPSDVFFDSARAGLEAARFQLKDGEHPRFGVSYTMPFVFRIAGAARLRQAACSLMMKPDFRPAVRAAQAAIHKLRGAA